MKILIILRKINMNYTTRTTQIIGQLYDVLTYNEMDIKWLQICSGPATTKEYCGEIPRKITNNQSQRSTDWDSKKESSKLKPDDQLTLLDIEELTPEYATD
jgi:hypothetical protein